MPNSYLGVTLGDSEQQVRNVLGEPREINSFVVGVSFLYEYDNGAVQVDFSPNTKGVRKISCAANICPPILEIRVGDDESKVRFILGNNAKEQLLNGGPWNASVVSTRTHLSVSNKIYVFLEQMKVTSITLQDPNEPRY